MKYFTACLALVCAVQVLAHSNGDIRLADGISGSMGRVEMFYQGQWGMICKDGIDVPEAQVICRSAGFSDSHPTVFNTFPVGLGTGRELLGGVRCIGNESNVLECSHNAIGDVRCGLGMAVDCYGRDIGSRVELRNGTATDGVLVLSHHDGFGTVCDEDWSHHGNLVVACRMLGVASPSVTPMLLSRTYYGETTTLPKLLSGIRCRGDETNLTQCRHLFTMFSWEPGTCTHLSDVAIDCLGSANLNISLVNGNDTAGEVRLVNKHGESGAVCGGFRRKQEAKVFCRVLGYGDYEGVLLDSRPLTSGTRMMLPRIFCQGNENNISQCSLTMGVDICLRSWGALAIACLPQADIAVRLADGDSIFYNRTDTSGRLEARRNGQWGGVCLMSPKAARVVCRMLNLPAENAIAAPIPRESDDPIVLDSVTCAGDEDHLKQCYIEQDCYGRIKDVWIFCQ